MMPKLLSVESKNFWRLFQNALLKTKLGTILDLNREILDTQGNIIPHDEVEQALKAKWVE